MSVDEWQGTIRINVESSAPTTYSLDVDGHVRSKSVELLTGRTPFNRPDTTDEWSSRGILEPTSHRAAVKDHASDPLAVDPKISQSFRLDEGKIFGSCEADVSRIISFVQPFENSGCIESRDPRDLLRHDFSSVDSIATHDLHIDREVPTEHGCGEYTSATIKNRATKREVDARSGSTTEVRLKLVIRCDLQVGDPNQTHDEKEGGAPKHDRHDSITASMIRI